MSNHKRLGTNPSKRGFKFCSNNRSYCRYCPKLNRVGLSKALCKENKYMKNISCRSSNLIYCITCKRCGIQYVGQTLLRTTDRMGDHFYHIEKSNTPMTVARHFSQRGHKSEAAFIIRDRVERRWIHLLRTGILQGLNIEVWTKERMLSLNTSTRGTQESLNFIWIIIKQTAFSK